MTFQKQKVLSKLYSFLIKIIGLTIATEGLAMLLIVAIATGAFIFEWLIAKGLEVWTTRIDQTLQEALRFLTAKKIDALLVLNADHHTVGILLEDLKKRTRERFETQKTAHSSRNIHDIACEPSR